MFEKEAIRYAFETTIGIECLVKPVEDFTYEELADEQKEKAYDFKEGAEFGYNKAKVEVEESYRESLCNSELNLTSITEQLEELEKANEWHNLRKNPNDLPEKEKLGQTFVVAFAFNEQTQKYYSFDCAEYIDKGRFITHTIDCSKENNAYKIIAWKEINTTKGGYEK